MNSTALLGIKEGDIPEEVILNDLNGKTVNVSGLFGKKPVILVFWELVADKSFLNYSLDELRFLNDFYEKHHNADGLEIFGIYTPVEEADIPESEFAEVQNLITANKISFPILIDRGFKMFREYGVIALPSTIMIGKAGKIEFIYPSFPSAALPLFSENILNLMGMQGVHKKEEIKIKGKDSQAARLYNYSLQMYKRGLNEQALSPLKKSLSLDPDSAWSHNLMGIILLEAGNYENSMEEFNRVIEVDKNNAAAHFNCGLLLFENEKYSDAEKYIKTAITLNKNMAEAHYILGLIYRKTNNLNGALKELETALVLFEEKKAAQSSFDSTTYHRISALVALSEIYGQSGNDKMCMTLLQKAARISLGMGDKPGDAHFHRYKGLLIYE